MGTSTLAAVAAGWASYFGNHRLVSVAIRFLHLAGIMVGGGAALGADRQILRAARGTPLQHEVIFATLRAAHTSVIPSLAVVVVTGSLMTLADLSTFFASRTYWLKLSLVGLLAVNGVALLLAERQARRDGAAAIWTRLVVISAVSAFLWLAVLFVGTLLTVVA